MKIRDMVFAGIITAVFGVNGAFVEAQIKPKKVYPVIDPMPVTFDHRCTCELTTGELVPVPLSFLGTVFSQREETFPQLQERGLKLCNKQAAAEGASMKPPAFLLKECIITKI